MEKKQIDGFLVFPERVKGSVAHVKIGVSIIPMRVQEIFSIKLIEKIQRSFGKKSEIFVDSKRGVAHISRLISPLDILQEVLNFKAELLKAEIHVIETPLPTEKEVNDVLAS